MKSLIQLVAAGCCAAILGVGCAAAAAFVKYQDEAPASVVEYPSENKPVSGMFFSTDNVVEEYEYDDAFCLLYDDADANLFECEIVVDLKTFLMVIKTIEEGEKLVGRLVLNEECSYDGLEVFTYEPDPDSEEVNEN